MDPKIERAYNIEELKDLFQELNEAFKILDLREIAEVAYFINVAAEKLREDRIE